MSNQEQTGPYVSRVCVADNGDGTYKNPVLHADYSDPDVIRHGEDFYLIASSFNCIPGLPILHSKDLVNWTLIGHALMKLYPGEVFDRPQHGMGCWAPSICCHRGEFRIYYCDPDYGIWMVKATNSAGPWSVPVHVLPGRGLIDPCPFWDDNGDAYLIHAWAASRVGVNSLLTIRKMNPAGTAVLDEGRHVFDGHDDHHTVEGPKFHRRNGYYYILAPAGGVATGWQLVLRSRDIYGPYEEKVVLEQGGTDVNGPHQGELIDTPEGEFWFVHFQDKGAYGHILHLQPVAWIDDWPVMGVDDDGDGTGQPVMTHAKPEVKGNHPVATPAESDEFDTGTLGLQWQWHANPKVTWMALLRDTDYLRLFAVKKPEGSKSLWDVPNLLLQKLPASDFTVTTKMRFFPEGDGKRPGLVVIGGDYAHLALSAAKKGLSLIQSVCHDAESGGREEVVAEQRIAGSEIYLRVQVTGPDATCRFSCSLDGAEFAVMGRAFVAKPGKWIGAKVGLFCVSEPVAKTGGYADFDRFHVE